MLSVTIVIVGSIDSQRQRRCHTHEVFGHFTILDFLTAANAVELNFFQNRSLLLRF